MKKRDLRDIEAEIERLETLLAKPQAVPVYFLEPVPGGGYRDQAGKHHSPDLDDLPTVRTLVFLPPRPQDA
jgi:hypothetical protein